MNSQYTYPGTDVLINKADIRDPEVLHNFERGRTALRHIEQEIIPIKGNFDLDHLKAIHKKRVVPKAISKTLILRCKKRL